ncbi:MAG: peptidoglycan DD-metalloendopeptidase family protein [Candidatus Liptonbacteria bacterium]|nr:peptidoglycan DD-metalloendopeptidase family protein [Candidatus Liptonbacteria bacterium]
MKVAVFLIAGLAFCSFFYDPGTGLLGGERGIFGGPVDQVFTPGNIILETASAFGEGSPTGGASLHNTALESSVFPGSLSDRESGFGQTSSREGLLVYRVQKGDTLSGISSYFGVSLDTIVNANPNVKARYLVPGDELKILPTSGSVYLTRDGDTMESISDYFNVPQDSLLKFNRSVNFNSLEAGVSVVIPGVKGYAQSKNSLPNLNSNFIIPAQGFNWGKLHHYNAVDIANSCGTPVVASAEGLVIPDNSFGDGRGGWSGGYGNFVLIEHPFGDSVRTRYAHLSKVLVDIGDYVKQGEEIGVMGDSGDSTGCHLHFEVYGAQNPFVR